MKFLIGFLFISLSFSSFADECSVFIENNFDSTSLREINLSEGDYIGKESEFLPMMKHSLEMNGFTVVDTIKEASLVYFYEVPSFTLNVGSINSYVPKSIFRNNGTSKNDFFHLAIYTEGTSLFTANLTVSGAMNDLADDQPSCKKVLTKLSKLNK